MTIGQRIRYYRQLRGMTQQQLASETGLHYVSIRRYEADMREPMPEQIRCLADALQVSYFALAGLDIGKLDANRESDLMSLLMLLTDSGMLDIHDQTAFSLHGCITDAFNLHIKDTDQTLPLNGIDLIPKSTTTAQSIIDWKNKKTAYTQAAQDAGEQPDEAAQATLQQMKDDLETIELQLQATDSLTKT